MESFLIAESYVPTEELLRVAKAVLKAQDIKEESWNGRKYEKDDFDAAIEAVRQFDIKEIWIVVIHGWNVRMWNDCQGWAQEIVSSSSNNQALA